MVYIAYKFSGCEDKQQLRNRLETISHALEEKGHKTFILYRDKKSWNPSDSNKLHSAFYMIFKLFFARAVIMFVDQDHDSAGLNFEFKYAKILNKPTYLFIDHRLREDQFRQAALHTIEFADANNLNPDLKTLIQVLGKPAK